jgi:hypothetical protein
LSIQTELRELDELRHARLEAKLDRLIGEVRSEMRAGFDRLDPVFDARHFDSTLDGFERRMTIRFFVYFISQGVPTAAMILWMVGILR